MVRIKHRYLLLHILYPENSLKVAPDTPDFLRFHTPTPPHVSSQVLLAHLRSHIAASFGDTGLGLCLSNLKIIYLSTATSTVILRVPRAHYQIVWATLSYMTEMPSLPGKRETGLKCVIRVVRVSGTIRKAEEELLRRSRQHVVKAKMAGKDAHTAVLNRLVGESDPLATNDTQFASSEEAVSTDSDSG